MGPARIFETSLQFPMSGETKSISGPGTKRRVGKLALGTRAGTAGRLSGKRREKTLRREKKKVREGRLRGEMEEREGSQGGRAGREGRRERWPKIRVPANLNGNCTRERSP